MVVPVMRFERKLASHGAALTQRGWHVLDDGDKGKRVSLVAT